ncbi:hypothetical protein NOGI109294_02385 [Nocardiopsis gilva]
MARPRGPHLAGASAADGRHPLRCGASRVTVNRWGLGEIAAYGRDASHHAFYPGAQLLIITTAEGAVTAFSPAHPKELDERKQALHPAHVQQIAPGPCLIVCDRGPPGPGSRLPWLP